MIQAAILILSAAAMWLVSGRSRHARLGWMLGLASLQTTRRYAHLAPDVARAALLKATRKSG